MATYSLAFVPYFEEQFVYRNQLYVGIGDVNHVGLTYFNSGSLTPTYSNTWSKNLNIDSTQLSTIILKLKRLYDVAYGLIDSGFSDVIRPNEDLIINATVSCGRTQRASASTVVRALSDTATLTFDKNIQNFEPVFVGEISGTTLNITSISQGEMVIGTVLTSSSLLAAGTIVTGYGTGSGGVGTYTVNISQTRSLAAYRGTNVPVSVNIELYSNNSRVFSDSRSPTLDRASFFEIEVPIVIPISETFTGIIQEPKFNFLDAQDIRSSATARASLGFYEQVFIASELYAPTIVTNARLSIINSGQVAGLTAEADDNVITGTDHGFDIGEPIIFVSLTGGVGLTENTVYWVIASGFTANTFRVSTTFGGSQVDITTDYTDMVAESRLREVLFSFRGSATATTSGQIRGGVPLSAQTTSTISSSGSLRYDYSVSSQITATSTSETNLGVVAPTLIQSESQIIVTGRGSLLVEPRVSGVPIFVNLNTKQISSDQIFNRPISEIVLVRNDVSAIDLKFFRDQSIVNLSYGSTGRIGIKDNYSGELLTVDSSWTVIESDGGNFYGFSLDMSTEGIQDLFVSGNENFVMAKIEIEWTESGTNNTTLPCNVKIYNDILR